MVTKRLKSSTPKKTSPAKKVIQDPVPERLERLRGLMDENKIDFLLIKSPENRRYFSGFLAEDAMISESSGVLLISLERNLLFTDFRFTTEALKEAPLFQVVTVKRNLAKAILEEGKVKGSLYFEADSVTVEFCGLLKAAMDQVELKALPFSLGELRMIKSEGELLLVKKAVEITERSLAELWVELEPGVPEEWAARFLENKFREYRAQGSAFTPIVAAGANAALPHAMFSKKKIGKEEMVVIDIGARYKGYCSDMTRTYMPQVPRAWQKEIYSIVKEAQERALEVLKAGAISCEVDKVARDHITEAGYGDYFGHSLGHGVGLLIHEEPRLSPLCKAPLKAGSLVTVEPGIYLPGKGGVRLEELVLITENGNEVLNKDDHYYYYR
ncbi:MAG: Xaa-Pro peptidase family protein [Deltaproteobacteria bacterium]|jgi:Xaa-Pro aminopeptidase|nr:Xaa-Pro peptidase family protein [Deltaproteobacteria bacterium]